MSGGQGTELSMAQFANLYEDSQGWKQTDYNSENLDKSGSLMRFQLQNLSALSLLKSL